MGTFESIYRAESKERKIEAGKKYGEGHPKEELTPVEGVSSESKKYINTAMQSLECTKKHQQGKKIAL